MKEFKATDKARILAMAKSQYNMFIVKRQRLENKLNVIEADFDMEQKLAEFKEKLEQKLAEKTRKLRADIKFNKEEQQRWTPEAISSMLDGHSIEELVDFSYSVSDTGKRSLVATFKYPDTILPPTPEDEAAGLGLDDVDEGPEYDGAGFNGSDEELKADMERATQEDEIRAMQDCEDKPHYEMPEMKEMLESVDEVIASIHPEHGNDFDEDMTEFANEPAPAPEPDADDYITDPEEEDPWADEDDDDDEPEVADDEEEDPFALR